jgi:MFS family permease
MIISYLLNKIKSKRKKEDLIFGLVISLIFGLVYGLVSGLIFGLVSGLIFGLVSGLVSGLVYVLVFGLFSGLVSGLVYGLVFGLFSGLIKIVIPAVFFPLWLFVALVIIIGEILFLMDRRKPCKKENRWWFVIKLKVESLFESLLILTNVLNIIYIVENVRINGEQYYPIITSILQFIGYGTIIITAIVIWLYLNKLRYRE